MLKSILAGIIGGAVGAGVWAALAYYANIEVGWIAWGIGALVGVCVRVAADVESTPHAVAAVIVAVVSVLAGKYAAVALMLQKLPTQMAAEYSLNANTDREFLISMLADDLIEEKEQAGETVQMPANADTDDDNFAPDYPPEIWNAAVAKWDAMGPITQVQHAKDRTQEFKTAMSQIGSPSSLLTFDLFIASFTPWDLLWFGLAAFTAFRIGGGKSN